MRITIVLMPPVDLSGGIRVIAIYAERLRRRGHDVLVVAPREPRPRLREILGYALKGKGWPPTDEKRESHFDGLAVERRWLDHGGPVTDADMPDADVVIATWWKTAEWVAALAPAKGAKVHFIQDYESWGGLPEQVDATYRLPTAKIVVSDWLRELLLTRFHQTAALVPNSVDTGIFFAPPRGKQATPTVGLMYSPCAHKGCDIIIRAYELARRELPNLGLVSVGNDEVTRDLPLPQGAEFTFEATEGVLREIYSHCDAWLFGTRREGFGLPILEAMACRTPVIGTPAGAAPDLLGRGGGILVPHEDPVAMARAIVEVCSMSDVSWRALSNVALATAAGYTWDDATDRFAAALQQARGSSQATTSPFAGASRQNK